MKSDETQYGADNGQGWPWWQVALAALAFFALGVWTGWRRNGGARVNGKR